MGKATGLQSESSIEGSSIRRLVRQYLEESADFQPVWGASLGWSGCFGRVADFSEDRRHRYLGMLQDYRTQLRALPVGTVGTELWLERQLLSSSLALKLRQWGEGGACEKNPTLYVGELIYSLWYSLLRLSHPRQKLKACLDALRAGREVFLSAQKNLRHPPKLWTQLAIAELEGYQLFLQVLRRELFDLAPQQRHSISAALNEAKKNSRDFLAWLRGPLWRRSSGEFAAGYEEFCFQLRHYHHDRRRPEQLKALGLELMASTEQALRDVAKQLSGRPHWKKLLPIYQSRHPKRGRLLRAYEEECAALKKFLRERSLVDFPKGESLEVVWTPSFTRATIPYAAYVDPPMFRGANRGVFFVTPPPRSGVESEELLQEHNVHALKLTALHEAYPGHHLQFAWQKKNPSVMARLFQCSSYYEGWALYCEELMAEQGYLQGADLLFQLKDKLWRACRIVVDVGLHTEGMSHGLAARFLAKTTGMSLAAARADVNWYSLAPTVPQGYLTGMLGFQSLRAKMRQRQGDRFSLKSFHGAVLRQGAIPLALLEKVLLPGLGRGGHE